MLLQTLDGRQSVIKALDRLQLTIKRPLQLNQLGRREFDSKKVSGLPQASVQCHDGTQVGMGNHSPLLDANPEESLVRILTILNFYKRTERIEDSSSNHLELLIRPTLPSDNNGIAITEQQHHGQPNHLPTFFGATLLEF